MMSDADFNLEVLSGFELIMNIATHAKDSTNEIVLSYEKDEEMTERINVPHINCLNYIHLKSLFKDITKEDLEWNEIYDLDYNIYDSNEISDVKLHVVDAGPYISGKSIVRGNCYTSDCDTYGSYYYEQYFLYQPEFDKYITIQIKRYAN